MRAQQAMKLVSRLESTKKSRRELLSTSEALRATTKSVGMWHFRPAAATARLHRRPRRARSAGGSPSTRRQHAAAAHSKAWRG